jgi:phosphohistidine phosphatase
MKTVVFCRHAKSDWPDGVADIDRPLKQRGVDDAQFLGNLLGEKSFQPDLIITSPANRARSTARLIARGISYTEEIRVEPNVYYEGVGSMLELVKELDPSLNSVMIFGHNPTMEQMVRYLLQAESRYEMPTSGMACFESYLDWKHFPDSCALRWLLVPRLQRKG